jgi:putative flippase GtrA
MSNSVQKRRRSEKLKLIIFTVVGLFNTVFDIVIYVVALNLTHKIFVANLISTSAALVGSYFLNSKYTFQSRNWTRKTFMSFAIVTIFGLWVLQTSCIYAINHLLTNLPVSFWQLFGAFEKTAKQVIPKLLATAVTLVWNYIWYNKVIFRNNSEEANRLAYTDL